MTTTDHQAAVAALIHVGFDHDAALAWAATAGHHDGEVAALAMTWRGHGIPDDEAAVWHRLGWTPDDAAPWALHGYTPAQATFVREALDLGTASRATGRSPEDLIREWLWSGFGPTEVTLGVAHGHRNLISLANFARHLAEHPSHRGTAHLAALAKVPDPAILDTPRR